MRRIEAEGTHIERTIKKEEKKAFVRGVIGNLLGVERKVPELTEREALVIDELMQRHEKVGKDRKEKPFTEKQKVEILKVWNYESPLSGIKDRRKGGKFALHIHHVLAKAFGGKTEVDNGIPVTREEHTEVHFGFSEAYTRYRQGNKEAFNHYTDMRDCLDKEPQLDKEARLYLQGRLDQRLADIKAWKKKKKGK